MDELERFVDRLPRARILIVGDLILDQYIWGEVNRISPEAPIPVVEAVKESFSLGGASNVANNLRTLGAEVEVCGVIGEDGYGRMLLDILKEKQIGIQGMITDHGRPTTLKTRIVAHKQQLVRVDRENARDVDGPVLDEMKSRILDVLPVVDAVILEDYGKGVIQADLLKEIVPMAIKRGKIVTVDPKRDHFSYYHGVTSITPNLLEAGGAAEIKISDSKTLHEAGARLMERLGCESVLITLGERGMCLFEKGESPLEIPAHAREVYDVSGAGDTVIAVFTAALVAGATPRQAAMLSNIAGGLVVEKLGTATVDRGELKKRLLEELKLRKLVAEFLGKSYNADLYDYTIRKLA